ncbi:MAG: M48 family metalloprotease [Myxococcales bacterium]|nr:M48 family metalloprotease [Myxococcales bacterium]
MWWRDPLRKRIEAELVVEREGWAVERARRVTDRLQGKLPEHDRFETIVIRSDDHNAFTAPGRTIYLSRRLLDSLPDDAAAAFVVAHELAHHHLGHVSGRYAGGAMFDEPIAAHEHELHADLHAIELCLAAGYEPERCIVALQMLDAILLDAGDLEAVLGAEHDREGEITRRGYLPVRERIARVQAHVSAYRSGARIVNTLTAERDQVARRRMRVALMAVGSIAATVALVLLRRR